MIRIVDVDDLTAPSRFVCIHHRAIRREHLQPNNARLAGSCLAQRTDLAERRSKPSVLACAERLGEPKRATLDRRHFGFVRPAHVKHLRLLPKHLRPLPSRTDVAFFSSASASGATTTPAAAALLSARNSRRVSRCGNRYSFVCITISL